MATISRKELHKKVWETPITRLSKEYGLSDVGFNAQHSLEVIESFQSLG